MSNRKDETRRHILETTWRLLEQHGAHHVRLEDVAAAAGVTRQSIYDHFGSRTGLLVEMTQFVNQETQLKDFAEPVRAARSGEEQLAAFIRLQSVHTPRIAAVARATDEARRHDEALAAAWNTPRQTEVLERVFPQLKKISIDFAVMEPASHDPAVRVAAVPMPLSWLDVGSWPSYAETCRRDENQNALASGEHVLIDSANCLAASSDPEHLIALVGCENLIVIHTPDATLVCRADQAERIKDLYKQIESRYGGKHL